MRQATMKGDKVGPAAMGIFGGHLMLLALMKRLRLVSSLLDPATIEDSWPDNHGAVFGWLSKEALGYVANEQAATRQELWAVIKCTAGHIEQYSPRCDHYPEGWADVAHLVKHGVRKAEPGSTEKPPEKDTTDYAEAAVEFVAKTKGMTHDAVLDAAGLKRPLCAADENRLLDMVR